MKLDKYLQTEAKFEITPEMRAERKKMNDTFARHQKAMRDNEKKIEAHFKKFIADANFTKETIAQFEKEVKQIVMKSDLQTDTEGKMGQASAWVDILRKIVKGTWR